MDGKNSCDTAAGRLRQGLAGAALLLVLIAAAPVVQAGLMDQEQLGKNLARVTGKAPNCIVIEGHSLGRDVRYVLVKSSARIYDRDGTRLSLAGLRLPCAGEVSLHHDQSQLDPELVTLKVLEYSPRARAAFTMQKPFVRRPE